MFEIDGELIGCVFLGGFFVACREMESPFSLFFNTESSEGLLHYFCCG